MTTGTEPTLALAKTKAHRCTARNWLRLAILWLRHRREAPGLRPPLYDLWRYFQLEKVMTERSQPAQLPTEKFNTEAGPCPHKVMEVEKGAENYPNQVGKLWTGDDWVTVAQARELRDWLNKVIP
jgi:hypothetical protein